MALHSIEVNQSIASKPWSNEKNLCVWKQLSMFISFGSIFSQKSEFVEWMGPVDGQQKQIS